MSGSLAGKVAVVTGGGAGIGGAISRLFGAAGAVVEVAEIDAARATTTVSEIESAGGVASARVVDVCEPEGVARLRDDVLEARGRVDVLVNNVGHYLQARQFRSSTPEHWAALRRINLDHVFLVTHALLPSMLEHHSGSIVNVSSVEGIRGYPGDPVYGAYKAALVHFTTCLAVELGRKGIRVNGIGPDLCQTPQVDYHAGTEGHEHMWESWAPVGRVGTPEEQAEVALFLASDASRFVTGHTIPTDGGSLAGGGWFWSPNRRRWVNRPLDP